MGELQTLLDTLGGLNHANLRFEIGQLEAIKAWAVRRSGGDFEVGDRVVIVDDLQIAPSSGWYHYREALAVGATAVVKAIEFNRYSCEAEGGAWHAVVMLDREWSVGRPNRGELPRYWHGPAAETPEGYTPPSPYDTEHYPEGCKHTFALLVRHVRKHTIAEAAA